jgi:hypothetical protein
VSDWRKSNSRDFFISELPPPSKLGGQRGEKERVHYLAIHPASKLDGYSRSFFIKARSKLCLLPKRKTSLDPFFLSEKPSESSLLSALAIEMADSVVTE